jgi:hypothetical protein
MSWLCGYTLSYLIGACNRSQYMQECVLKILRLDVFVCVHMMSSFLFDQLHSSFPRLKQQTHNVILSSPFNAKVRNEWNCTCFPYFLHGVGRTTFSLIYKDECLYVPYTNPHFCTDRNQTLHTSPLWSGRDCRIHMDPQYFNFSTVSASFVVKACMTLHKNGCWRHGACPKALYPWLWHVFMWTLFFYLQLFHNWDVELSFTYIPRVICYGI